MHITFIILGATTFCVQLYAAFLWTKASKLRIRPDNGINSGEKDLQTMSWVTAIMENIAEVADLNRKAAFWTGVGAGLSALSAIFAVIL